MITYWSYIWGETHFFVIYGKCANKKYIFSCSKQLSLLILHISNVNDFAGTTCMYIYWILDGRTSEDSAVDLGDIITDEDEIVEELIKRGMLIPTPYIAIVICAIFSFLNILSHLFAVS